MRLTFLFEKEAASEQGRIFAGPFLPWRLIRQGLLPALPAVCGLRFQALHTDAAAEAYRAAVVRPVRGPFNLVADPVLDTATVAGLLHARTLPLPAGAARAALAAAWRVRLVPADPGCWTPYRGSPCSTPAGPARSWAGRRRPPPRRPSRLSLKASTGEQDSTPRPRPRRPRPPGANATISWPEASKQEYGKAAGLRTRAAARRRAGARSP
ncbi:hypothetical protein [Streptomyces sp. NPDC001502]|uniref:hypothetical protein n=1 Tax=Streptomyces sp. NPDC001502 TaxID=3364578 RepID=UPI0036A1830D